MAKIVNLTPHPVVICDGEGRPVVTFAPAAVPARCSSERRVVGEIEVGGVQIPLTSVVLGELVGLPEPQDGVFFVASRIACEAAKTTGRSDLLCPDDVVRDADGHIIGVKSLARV